MATHALTASKTGEVLPLIANAGGEDTIVVTASKPGRTIQLTGDAEWTYRYATGGDGITVPAMAPFFVDLTNNPHTFYIEPTGASVNLQTLVAA